MILGFICNILAEPFGGKEVLGCFNAAEFDLGHNKRIEGLVKDIKLDQERVDAEPVEPVTSTVPMTRWQRSIDPIKLVRTLIPRLQEAGMPDDLLLNIVKALNG